MKKKLFIYTVLLNCIFSFSQTTVNTPQELTNALSTITAGGTIYISDATSDTYTFTTRISITKNGTSGNIISLLPHPNNTSRILLNFSSMAENSTNRAITLSGSYWHIKGIDVFGAGDNGMFISGSTNLIEFCTFSECKDSGLKPFFATLNHSFCSLAFVIAVIICL